MRDRSRPSSPLQLVVLALVYEAPQHPYRMHTLIRERGKDQIANVAQRNSVYQAIRVLERAGLIEALETERDERRPERTIYGITDKGRRTLPAWLSAMLSTPAREFPDFPAALAHVAGLAPKALRPLLEARQAALEAHLQTLQVSIPGLPRVFSLEAEYLAAVTRAEVKWLQAVVADLRSGRLTWSDALIRKVAVRFAKAEAAPNAAAKPRARKVPRGR